MKPYALSTFLLFIMTASLGQTPASYATLGYDKLDSLIGLCFQEDRYQDAMPVAMAYIQRAEEEGNDSLRARGLKDLGLVHWRMNNYSEALSYYLQAKDLEKRFLGIQHPDYAISVNMVGVLYQELGVHEKAIQCYTEAKDLDEQVLGKNHPYYAGSLSNLANAYVDIGNYTRAEPLYLEAREIWAQTQGTSHPDYAIAVNNLAYLYMIMEQFQQASSFFSQALEIVEKTLGREHYYYTSTIGNLAYIYEVEGQYEKALPLFMEAKDINEKVRGKKHPDYAASLINLAELYKKMGEYDKALPLLVEANRIDKEILGEQHPDYASSLNNLAELYGQMRLPEKAWDILHAAMNGSSNIETMHTFDDMWLERLTATTFPSNAHVEQMMRSLGIAFQLLRDQSTNERERTKQQINVAKLANVLLVKVRNEVSDEEDKLRMLSQSHEWLQRSLHILNPETDAHKAFGLADQNKSVLLLQATKSELAYRLGELPDSLIWKEQQLLQHRSQLKAKLLGPGSESVEDSLISELNHVNQALDEFVRMVKTNHPKYHQIKYQQNDVSVPDIQASMERGSALLEYVTSDSSVHIFYVDQSQIQWHQFPIASDALQKRIQSLHQSLNDYASADAYAAYSRQAHWFYQNLIAPAIEGKTGITHLIIVPDGELGHLPFETFLVEEASEQEPPHYLLNDYSISYSYSATLWKENMEAPKPRNNGEMLAVAADYDVALDSAMLAVRLPTDQWRRGELTELPAARKEVETLQSKYAGFFAFDTVASERTVKAMAPDYSILHFATHGFLDKDRPVLSSLAFTEDSDSTESNFWQAYEISKTQLNADLVVLSACETGYGKFETGNGIASLARAFMYAGAPALVVSLWQVHDEATSELMTSFYDHLDSGMDKDEALRQAKLDFIQSAEGIQQHPAFWSPFIMMGKTDPIEIRKKGEGTAWAIGIAVFVVLVMGGVFLRRRR